jgi:hypothetical protein
MENAEATPAQDFDMVDEPRMSVLSASPLRLIYSETNRRRGGKQNESLSHVNAMAAATALPESSQRQHLRPAYQYREHKENEGCHPACNNNRSISFMPSVASTSGRLHCELIRISRYFVPCRHILRLSASLLLPDISMCDLTRARSDSATLLSTPESGLKSKVGRLIAKASALEPRQSQC